MQTEKIVLTVGFDEAGRGPLAGPVYASAVILPKDFPFELLNDSKKLSPKKREKAEVVIKEKACYGIAFCTEKEIDEINILQASLLCMKRALDELIKKLPDWCKKNIINYDDYVINLEKRTVELNNKNIKMTTLEFDLLLLFIKNKDKCFSREEILNSVWGNDYFGTDRVVDDLVRRVRKKLPNVKIDAIYGYGYRLL